MALASEVTNRDRRAGGLQQRAEVERQPDPRVPQLHQRLAELDPERALFPRGASLPAALERHLGWTCAYEDEWFRVLRRPR